MADHSGQKRNHSAEMSDTQLSKKLSWLLRHGALKEGIFIGNDGYILEDAIMKHPKYVMFTLDVLKRLVENDAKKRYTLKFCNEIEQFSIKANQGHSISFVEADRCLARIEKDEEVRMAVHGTYYRHWPNILREGLRVMGRNQIHFAATDKLVKGTSGFRHDCQLLIYVDVAKAINQGDICFYRSENNVILSNGKAGVISKEYFLKVVDRKTALSIKF